MQNQCMLFSLSARYVSYLNASVISQGKAATYLKHGKIYYVTRITNFFLEFGKLVDI